MATTLSDDDFISIPLDTYRMLMRDRSELQAMRIRAEDGADYLIGIDEVMRRLSCGRTTLHEKRLSGELPKPYGEHHKPKWLSSDIEAYLRSKPLPY